MNTRDQHNSSSRLNSRLLLIVAVTIGMPVVVACNDVSPGEAGVVSDTTGADSTVDTASVEEDDVGAEPDDDGGIDTASPGPHDEDVSDVSESDIAQLDAVFETCPTYAVTCSVDGAAVSSPFTSERETRTLQADCGIAPAPPSTATVAWQTSRDGLPLGDSFSGRTARLLASQVGELKAQAVVTDGGTTCDAVPLVWNVLPPSQGLFVTFSWDGPPGMEYDLDLHMVREGASFDDQTEDLFFRTIDAGLDWGEPEVAEDDPIYVWDSQHSPGAESGWVERPATDETIHLAVFGFKVPAGTDGQFEAMVFVQGVPVSRETYSVENNGWVALGALSNGEFVASYLYYESGTVAPSTVSP